MKKGKGRKALGAGLRDLDDRGGVLPVARSDAGATQTLAIAELVPNPFQPRRDFDESEIDGLARSVKESGVLQPLLVRPAQGPKGTHEILAGERRWRAAQRAGLHEVPVVVRKADDREAAAIALIENVQRSDLNAIEEAAGYRRLIEEFGITQEDLARHVGKSRSHVANTMRLLGLPERVQGMIADGRLSAGHGRAALAAKRPEAVADAAASRGLNVRQTERLAKRDAAGPRAPEPPDPNIAALEGELRGSLGLAVRVRHRGGKGEVRVSYSSLEQLDEVVRRLKGG